MTDRAKRPRDASQLAKFIVDVATGESEDISDEGKDPSAVERGRMGGKIGGKVRASRMSPEDRSKAALKAARARWSR